jgi:hypothetical protein
MVRVGGGREKRVSFGGATAAEAVTCATLKAHDHQLLGACYDGLWGWVEGFKWA